MRRRAPPVPPELRHRIVQAPDGWRLETHHGYVLMTAPTRADVEAYYATHCPE